MDGTLIQAWASMKSFRRKDGNDQDRRDPDATASGIFTTTDAPTRRMPQPLIQMRGWPRKSKGQRGDKLAFTGHLLMENRNGLLVDARLTHSTGTAECEAALGHAGRFASRRARDRGRR